MKILVTGGAGMIGSNLTRRLVNEGHSVRVVDNLWRGKREYLLDGNGRPVIDLEKDLHVRDLSIPGQLDDLLDGVDAVYHLADIVAGIGYVFNHQGWIFRQNLLINSNVVESVRNRPVAGFIYVGTACSFPQKKQFGVEAPPLREEDQYPADPESAYGWSKLMGEYEAGLLEEEAGIPVSILSLHNVYGAPCDYSETSGQVIPSLIRKAVRFPEETFEVWGSGAQPEFRHRRGSHRAGQRPAFRSLHTPERARTAGPAGQFQRLRPVGRPGGNRWNFVAQAGQRGNLAPRTGLGAPDR